ncbi:cytochrome P450 [Flavisphingomonas formosensis]|uniref:cytochrome P450 n=1 Tax=Flavisphingomonas formosensis TaxID=861534 RepID=UPI0012FAA0CA|nr:cytochrome P450 [Sphingomonas formosensis]
MCVAEADPILNQPQIYDPYEYALHDDPYPVYRRLRDEFPLYYNRKHDFYAVSRYADCMTVLRNFKTFINGKSTTLEKEVIPGSLPFILSMDPPDHTRLRHLMVNQFRPHNVAPLEEVVRETARKLLAPHAGTGRIDIIADFAAKLPMAIICALMGVDPADEDMLRGWTDDIVHREDGSNEIVEVNITGTRNLLGYFEEMIQGRLARGEVGEDIVGQLIAFEQQGKLNHAEVLGYLYLLAIAGNETTTKLIGNFTYQLWENRHERDRLIGDPSLAAGAVEETLRIDGPTQMQGRETAEPFELHGHTIPAGSKVAVILTSGNRDERHYDDPETYRMDRGSRDHLGFGGGLHSCLGAALARLEGRIALEEMLATMPDWDIDLASTRRMHSAYVRGYTHLPLTFTPRSAA